MNNSQLNKFLLKSKTDLKSLSSNANTCVHVVIGNESCDLDSAVSSVVYAFFMFLGISADSVVIPVINVLKKRFEVKTEVKYFFNLNNITDDSLVFRDEIDLEKLHQLKRLKLILVDHHVLQNDLKALGEAVTTIVDHRPRDSRAVWSENVAINIQKVGSCCSLIGQEVIKKGLLNDQQIATLICGTILLDTSNFSPLTKKATPLDSEIVSICESEGKINFSRQELYDKLVSAKTDTSNLSTYSLLIKDMKKVYCLPISVLTISVKDFLERPDAEKTIKEFCIEQEAQVFLILGVIVAEGSQLRDLFIYPHSCQQLADSIEEHLKSSTEPKLDLQMVEHRYGGKIFKEINTYTTRKLILPIVERAIENYEKSKAI